MRKAPTANARGTRVNRESDDREFISLERSKKCENGGTFNFTKPLGMGATRGPQIDNMQHHESHGTAVRKKAIIFTYGAISTFAARLGADALSDLVKVKPPPKREAVKSRLKREARKKR